MCTHLNERNGRYEFRRRVPKELQAVIRKTELYKGFGRIKRAEAVRLCRAESLRSDELFAELRADLARAATPTPAISDPISVKVRSIINAAQSDANAKRAGLEDAERDRLESDEWYQSIVSHARDEGLDEDEALEFDRDVERRMQIERAAKRLLKDEEAERKPPQLQRAAQPPVTGKPTLYFTDLIDAWDRERKKPQRTLDKAARAVRRFRELVGLMPIRDIQRSHIIAFKDALLSSGQTGVNTNKQIEQLSILLNFACKNDRLTTNVAKGIRAAVRKAGKPVISFSEDALQAIFSSPVYSENTRPAGGAGEAAYWLPLLALFTGARLEELCQLAPDDIREEAYIDADDTRKTAWCLRLVHNDERGQAVKNAGSVRRIPLHPDLIALGFVAYAHSHKGKPRIFPALKPNSYGEESGNWSKWFGKYLRGPCGVTDKRMVFYSFRHTFKDTCRERSIGKDVADAMQGHDDGDASSGYGSEFYPLRPLVEALSLFRIHGLTVPGVPATPPLALQC
ncbi:DUF6538 domain-containing protein [Paraburkholderia sp. MM5482-R1]|uniref:DUF6538 domain-containing protein n=1 Tax=unclassified Paraburkholderia TaxID=2615204 RepID=UPI003D229C37